MANLWELPKTVSVNGKEYDIRTDFRAVLDVLTALSSKELKTNNKVEKSYIINRIILEIMFPKYEEIPQEDIPQAIEEAVKFIDMDSEKPQKDSPILMDWEQDARIIIPAINNVAGFEIREKEYLHWWTFLSYYMGIGECTFSHIVGIRSKKIKGEKLMDWEQKFIKENPDMVLLHEKLTDEEKAERYAEMDEIDKLLGLK
ncbi:MAG: Gp15 family bacteriophage protein [Prevotellaceae bacterium]|nr:Gp15 family bacteriophage protein [Prevotellaceae bacterium]